MKAERADTDRTQEPIARRARKSARCTQRGDDVREHGPQEAPAVHVDLAAATSGEDAKTANAWSGVVAGTGHPLPEREPLEAIFGRTLPDVRVHSGARARAFLEASGAEAATDGRDIALRDAGVPLPVLAHELAHVLQAQGRGDGGAEPTGAVVPELHAAEREADALAADVVAGRMPSAPTAVLPAGALALSRTAPEARAATSTEDEEFLRRFGRERPSRPAEEASEVTDDERETDARGSRRAPGGGGGGPRRTPAAAAEPGERSRREREAPERPRPDGTEAAAPEAGLELAPEARGPPEAACDRQEQINEAADATADVLDAGETEASDAEVEPCPDNANPEGSAPWEGGEQPDVPDVDETAPEALPEPEATDHSAVDTARGAMDDELGTEPARAGGAAPELDPEQERARSGQMRALQRRVGNMLPADESVETETIDTTGDADPERAETFRRDALAEADTHRDAARTSSEEDYGEDRLAPTDDPTLGHATDLPDLETARPDMAETLDRESLANVATVGNAGEIGRDDILVVDEDVEQLQSELTQTAESRREGIETEIQQERAALRRRCGEAREARERELGQAEAAAGAERSTWQNRLDDHDRDRRQEMETELTTRVAHTETLRENGDRDAQATVDEANTEASRRWSSTRREARARADNVEEESWWDATVDWIQARLEDLADAIESFIEAARGVINGFLEAARNTAHAIVQAAHSAITATLDGARDVVNRIADNLPGELGEIAREGRDAIFQVLDAAQATVDAAAQALHQGIDDTIDAVEERVNAVLDALEQAVRDGIDALNDLLENGMMAFLRSRFPALADLIDNGLMAPINQAADALGGWINDLIDASGLGQLEQLALQVEALGICEQDPFGATPDEDCESFQRTLDEARESFDELLQSPTLVRIRDAVQEAFDDQAQEQAGLFADIFNWIAEKVRPLVEWWQENIQPAIDAAVDWLGCTFAAIWRHIAEMLGLDVNLDPLTAIAQKLQELWDEVMAAIQPVLDEIREFYRWLREDLLGPVFEFFAAVRDAWNWLVDTVSQVAGDVFSWLAEQAEAIADAVGGFLGEVLQGLSRVLHRAIDGVEAFFAAVIGVIERLLGWEAPTALLQALARLVRAHLTVLRVAMGILGRCFVHTWRAIADGITNLWHWLRVIVDIAIGFAVALPLGPPAWVLFLAGNTWRFLVPECYKAPILNFILDIYIRWVEFLPTPREFMWAMLKNGALGFLRGLREAPDAQKIAAMDLIASLFGGNLEAAAGFAVGLIEGVWESTGGTIIFILQAIAWLISLPIKLLLWGARVAGGLFNGNEEHDAAVEAQGADAQAEPAADDATTPETSAAASTTDAAPAAAVAETAPPASTAGDSLEDPAEEARAEEEIGRDTADIEATPDAEGGGASDAEAEIEAEAEEMEEEDVPDEAAVEEGAEAEPADAAAPAGGAEAARAEGDEPPDAQQMWGETRGLFQRLWTEGITAEDVQTLMDSIREALAGMAEQLGRSAATSMLEALTARGAAFQIGRALGTAVGMIVVEIVLAVFTAGGTALITAAKGAITAARGVARLGSILARVQRALQPLFRLLSRLRRTLGRIWQRVRTWFDDVVRWMSGRLRRAGQRVRRALQRGRRGGRRGVGRGRRAGRRGRGRRGGNRRRGGRGRAYRLALRAATIGWQRASADTRRRVRSRREVERRLSGIRVTGARNVRVTVNPNRMAKTWTITASVRAGRYPGRASRGRGWLLDDPRAGRGFQFTKDSQQRLHHDIVEDTFRALGRRAERLEERGELRQRYNQFVQATRSAQQRGQGRIRITGVRFEVDPEPWRRVEGDRAVRTDIRIRPNSTEVGPDGQARQVSASEVRPDPNYVLSEDEFLSVYRRAGNGKRRHIGRGGWASDLEQASAAGQRLAPAFDWDSTTGWQNRVREVTRETAIRARPAFDRLPANRRDLAGVSAELDSGRSGLGEIFRDAIARDVAQDVKRALDRSRHPMLADRAARQTAKDFVTFRNNPNQRGAEVQFRPDIAELSRELAEQVTQGSSSRLGRMEREWITETLNRYGPQSAVEGLSWAIRRRANDSGIRVAENARATLLQDRGIRREHGNRASAVRWGGIFNSGDGPLRQVVHERLGRDLVQSLHGHRALNEHLGGSGSVAEGRRTNERDTSYTLAQGPVGRLRIAGSPQHGADPQLKAAVSSSAFSQGSWTKTGVVAFMADMAAHNGSRADPTISWSRFSGDDTTYAQGWDYLAPASEGDQPTTQVNSTWIKDRFRGGGGLHEWIPSNYIREVLVDARRAAEEENAVEAIRWVHGHDTLRSPTDTIIYPVTQRFVYRFTTSDPPGAADMADDSTAPLTGTADRATGSFRGNAVIRLSGHVGALYLDRGPTRSGYPVIVGQGQFHDDLRDLYESNRSGRGAILRIARAMVRYARNRVWNGDESVFDLPPDVDPNDVPMPFLDSRGQRVLSREGVATTTLGGLAASQRVVKRKMLREMNRMVDEIRTFGA